MAESSHVDKPGVDEVTSRLVEEVRRGRLSRRDFVKHAAIVGMTVPAVGVLSGTAAGATRRTLATPKRATLRLALGGGSLKETLDPAIAAGTTNNVLIGLTSETLLTLDPDTWKPSPGLAERWSTDRSASVWTLHLRKGVRWHDGKPLTSRDVAYSLKRHLDPKGGSSLFATLSPYLDPAGVRVVNASTVQLRLKRPNAFLYLGLGMHRAQIVQDGTTDFSKTLVGTGPFRVKSFSPGVSFEAVRSATYWIPGKPLLGAVQAVTIPEVAGQVRSVLAGQSHIGVDVDSSAVEQARRNPKALKLLVKKSEQDLPIVFDRTKPPFDNLTLVAAIKAAVDRKRVVDVAFRGLGERGNDFPAPPSDGFYPAGTPVPAQNIPRVKQLLSQAGYPNGIDITLLASQAGAAMMDEAIVFAETVQAAGINLTVKQVPTDTYWDKVWLTEPAYVSNWNRRHPWQALSELFRTDAKWNESRVKLPQVDALLDQAARTPAFGQQQKLIGQALKLVGDNAGWVVPGWVHQISLASTKVTGVKLGVLAQLSLVDAQVR